MSEEEELLAKAKQPAVEAVRLHPFYRGKIQTTSKVPIGDASDFAIWYTPGVAAPCRLIDANPDLVYEHTNKANMVAIVSDGSRVLGLGDIGPHAGLPVMEGKALLFKYLGGIDAVPLCLQTSDPDELIRTVEILEPSFGGINLEDISQPKCFRILDALRERMPIPVWHDDQQGTATVVMAALLNALKIVNKRLDSIRIAMIGMGAANVANYRMLKASGVGCGAIVACDSRGVLHAQRHDLANDTNETNQFSEKWRICQESNEENLQGGIEHALRGADVCLAFASPGPDLIRPEWVKAMAQDAIVFACANPIPEIWPWQAEEAGACIVATGRSDFANQVNNSLAFPGVFRGALDVRASAITDEMALAAAAQLAASAEHCGLTPQYIVPRMDQWEVVADVAVATGVKAQQQGVARLRLNPEQLHEQAMTIIGRSREICQLLVEKGKIPAAPKTGDPV